MKFIKKLQEEYPQGVELYCVDYDDRIEDADTQNKVVKTGELDDFYRYYNTSDIIDSIIKDVFTNDEQKEIFENEEIYQSVCNWCHENDVSDPNRDILKNTGEVLMFYDLGHKVMECNTDEEVDQEVKNIAKHLNTQDKEFLKSIRTCVLNACHGGNLCLLFDGKLEDFYGEKDWKYLNFNGATIGIIDRSGGSGRYVDTNIKISVPFDRNRIYVDEAYGYSVKDIFGINYINNDGYNFTTKIDDNYIFVDLNKEKGESKLDKAKKKEEFFEAEYKKGICYFEDTKLHRHSVEYINEYPCGRKCKRCGRFFID